MQRPPIDSTAGRRHCAVVALLAGGLISACAVGPRRSAAPMTGGLADASSDSAIALIECARAAKRVLARRGPHDARRRATRSSLS